MKARKSGVTLPDEANPHSCQQFVISMTKKGQRKPSLWWSNTDGWGSIEAASVFPSTNFVMPILMDGSYVKWEKLP